MQKFNSLHDLANAYNERFPASVEPLSTDEVIDFHVDEVTAATAKENWGIDEDIYMIPRFGYVPMDIADAAMDALTGQ